LIRCCPPLFWEFVLDDFSYWNVENFPCFAAPSFTVGLLVLKTAFPLGHIEEDIKPTPASSAAITPLPAADLEAFVRTSFYFGAVAVAAVEIVAAATAGDDCFTLGIIIIQLIFVGIEYLAHCFEAFGSNGASMGPCS